MLKRDDVRKATQGSLCQLQAMNSLTVARPFTTRDIETDKSTLRQLFPDTYVASGLGVGCFQGWTSRVPRIALLTAETNWPTDGMVMYDEADAIEEQRKDDIRYISIILKKLQVPEEDRYNVSVILLNYGVVGFIRSCAILVESRVQVPADICRELITSVRYRDRVMKVVYLT